MATADQIARAAASQIDFEYKFFTGGKRSWVNLDNIEVGQPYTPTVATFLVEDLDPDETDITVDDASSLTTGAVVIHPYGDHPWFEVVAYADKSGDTLTGCIRQGSTNPLFGYHQPMAPVSEWHDITELVLDVAETEDKQEGIVRWQARLSGIQYNSTLLDNDNSVLCMARFRPGAGGAFDQWTEWQVQWLGYIKDLRVPDDSDALYRWRATVEGISQYLESTDVSAREYGRQNVAKEKTVTVSSALEDPYQELDSGEYVGFPDLGGSNAVDEDMGTLWISDGEPASTPAGVTAGCGFQINEVYLRAQPGYLDEDMQWIEIYCNFDDEEDHELAYYYIANRDSTWFQNNWDPPQYQLENNYLDLSQGQETIMVSDGGFVILCADKPKFLERWGTTGADHVLDWRGLAVGDFGLRIAGDKLGLFFFAHGDPESVVFWGDETVQNWNPDVSAGWTGSTIPTDLTNMPVGHSFHRKPEGAYQSANDIDDFELRVGAPKYNDDHPTPGAYITGDPEYLSVDMGLMGIVLTATLLIGETDEMEVSSTLGLTASGRVQIDAEQIDYETRDDANNKLLTLTRGVGGTSAAQHNVDAVVAQVEDSTAYQQHLISQVAWRRRKVWAGSEDDTYLIVPQNFHVYTSTLASPIYPDDETWNDDWEDYWTLRATEQDWEEAYYEKTFEPMRARHVMISVLDMTDAGRVKLNEFMVYAHSMSPIDGQMPDVVRTGDVIKHLICTSFGLSEDLFTMTEEGLPFVSLPVSRSRYLQVIADLCKRTGTMVVFGRDHSVEHTMNPEMPLGALPVIEMDWSRDRAQSVEMVRPYRHNVSQIILRVLEPATMQHYEARYPPSPLRLGSVVQMDDYVVGGAENAQLMAQMHFHQQNGRLTATVVPAGLLEWARPGQRHTVTWELDVESTYLQARNFIVVHVERTIVFGDKGTPPRYSASMSLEELIF